MRYFKDQTNEVYGYDQSEPTQLPYIEEAINKGWTEITGSFPLAETQQQAQNRLTPAVTSAINDGAQSWGYDSIESAVSYVTSSNPQYVAEAQAMSQWRDDVWEWAIPRLASVAPNTTAGEFLATIPDVPPKP
jgi:uncharacterized protein (UPF0297 family)